MIKNNKMMIRKKVNKKTRNPAVIAAVLFLLISLFLIILSMNVSALSQCSDSRDNDCDGKIDLQDSGCSNSSDNSEDVVVGYASGCLTRGDKLKNACGKITSECNSDLCQLCVLMTESGNYSGAFYKCNGKPACGFGAGSEGGQIDANAPNLTINNPRNNSFFTKRMVLFDITISENAKLERYDERLGRWIKMCDSCRSYSRGLSFKDGKQEVLVRATDSSGNSDEEIVSFFVDSKKPRISKTYPNKNEYIGSEFSIVYNEDNLKEIKLNYGNSLNGYEEEILTGCNSGKKQTCSINVDLSSYDNQQVEYWFSIKDMADNVVESKKIIVNVDETYPIINQLDYMIKGRKVIFNISIEERNFDSIEYIDWQDSRPRFKKLCSRLKDNRCEKKQTFKLGNHVLDIQVTDKAGNSIARRISFDII